MDPIIITGLRKVYGLRSRVVAVDGLELTVPQGAIFGFLGPNGSGKTTTIRCLLGLARPSNGETLLLGASPSRLHTVIRRVGTLVETPAFFPNFTGRRNLELLALLERLPAGQIKHVLSVVGLEDAADRNYSSYSLGMKQRLGLAGALLKDPEILILDEPTNGLDPGGIAEVRELLISLGKEGRTIFLSSHQLKEVEEICDSVGIISRGRTVLQGRIQDIGGPSSTLICVSDVSMGKALLNRSGLHAEISGGALLIESMDTTQALRALSASGVAVEEVRPLMSSLEETFIRITEGGDRR